MFDGPSVRQTTLDRRLLARDGYARLMPIAVVPLSNITDWDSFHATFAEALGFPDFYGRNMNAWIDCLTYEDDGMTAFPIEAGDVLTIQLQDCKDFRERCPEIYEALVDSAAFVNWRRIEMGERPILAISYH
jgi:RNAse (barnase) inhibitor barstar